MLCVRCVVTVAMMSRPVAGVRNKALIITLPGSPKGAKENLNAVIRLLPHACMQAAGANSRSLHAGRTKSLEAGAAEAGHQKNPSTSHHCVHGHVVPKARTTHPTEPSSNALDAPPTRRHRSSPYPVLSVDDALSAIATHTPDPKTVQVPVDDNLTGYVLAEDVYSPEAVPGFRASIVDGYAIVIPSDERKRIANIGGEEVEVDSTDTRGRFNVSHVSHAQAGDTAAPVLLEGNIARITTGAPLPEGANAVVMVEDTYLISSSPDGIEENVVEILAADIKPGENIRNRGSDVDLGQLILQKGDMISSVGGEIGALAATGVRSVMVYKKPVVGILSTGDELVGHNEDIPLKSGQVRDSNRLALITTIKAWGYPSVDLGVARDTPSSDLEHHMRMALRGTPSMPGVDVIVTTGGVSMGELDLLKPTIEHRLGGSIHVGRVSMKPGKPTTFATIPFKPTTANDQDQQAERETRLVFGLPGNPASALVTINLFVLPALHKLAGHKLPHGLPAVTITISHDIPSDRQRTEYHRATVAVSREHGTLMATSTGLGFSGGGGAGQRSSRVLSLAGANALLVLKPRQEGYKAGDKVMALLMRSVVSE